MENRHPGRVQDYTTANLILIFVNLLWIFGLIWSAFGLGPVLLLGLVLNRAVDRLETVRARRQVAARKRAGPNMPEAPPSAR